MLVPGIEPWTFGLRILTSYHWAVWKLTCWGIELCLAMVPWGVSDLFAVGGVSSEGVLSEGVFGVDADSADDGAVSEGVVGVDTPPPGGTTWKKNELVGVKVTQA